MFSVIIPVLHESDIIRVAIEHIQGLCDADQCEIIVVDGSASHDTISVIADLPVIRLSSPQGRAVQMNKGAESAQGDILVFLHADTTLPHHAFKTIADALYKERNNAVAGAFNLCFDTSQWWLTLIAYISSIRSRITKIPYGDQAIFIKKDYFNVLKSYKNIPLMEDVELMKRIKKNKGRVCIVTESVTTSARKWKQGGLLKTTIKNRLLRILYACGINTKTLYKLYYKN